MTTRTDDGLNRLSQIAYDDGSTITYSYDSGNRLTTITDSVNGSITRTYDNRDRLTSETTAQGTISYTYDLADRRATMTVAGQTVVTYGYDAANRLTSVTQGTATVTITYDDADRRATLTLPNGIVTTYGYDNANQLTGLTYTRGTTTLGTLTYGYDLAGRRVQVGGTWARTGLPEPVAPTNYDAGNRLLNWSGNFFSYDSNGNLASDGLTSYTWGARNQLTGLSGATSDSFAYDALERRRSKTIGATTTNFMYDGVSLVQELSSGGVATANLLTGARIDETFTRADASGTTSTLVDALGSALELADASSTLLTHYTYEPFGATTMSGSTSTNAAQFTGRENDGTGLYYYRARYYAPGIGRFLSEDPARSDSHLYAYVQSNPVTLVDPLGLKAGDPYGSIDQAAIAALQEWNPISIEINREYGGSIYCEAGTYKYTVPNLNLLYSDYVWPSSPPAGKKLVGRYHTHGRDGNDGLSGPDQRNANRERVPWYVGTPLGRIIKYDPAVGFSTEIGRTGVPR
jgi:RHS repeat-associated protein